MSFAGTNKMTNMRSLWHGITCLFLLTLGGAAQAQSEFTYNGVVDFSYGRFEPSGFYRNYQFNSNSLSATFVGGTFKHGLDDGWTPGVTLETFIRLQDLRTGRRDTDPLLSRNAFVFLNSKYGNVKVGRLQTLLFDTTTRFNALGNSVVFSPAVKHVFASGNLEGVQGDFYWNRAGAYTSPTYEGITANVMYAKGSHEQDGDYAGANVVMSRGLFAAALSVQHAYVNDGIEDPTKETTWQLGATYNFGLARVFGLYTQTRDLGLEVNSKITSGGFSFPLGPGSVLMQMGYTTATGLAVDRKHTSTSAGYLYPYDSQTDLYVLTMDDRIRGQTRGVSVAGGARIKF
ncbi:MAG: porin [Rubrivivax sp.]|nr:MAG: porin [Rubrivivax sp.]